MRYDAVVFDLDGTLLDTLGGLTDSVNYAMNACGLPPRSAAQVRADVGNGAARLIELSVSGGRDNALYGKALEAQRAYYADHCLKYTVPYPGIMDMLRALRDARVGLAIVTNKADAAAQTLRSQFFGGLIGAAVGEREGVPRKPAPDMVLAALDKLCVPRERAVYVGDSEVDIITARNMGMDCLSVSWGFRGRLELQNAGAEIIADNPGEILNMVLSLSDM